jgi:hypothetical protein
MPRLRHCSEWTGAEVMFDVFVSYGQVDQGVGTQVGGEPSPGGRGGLLRRVRSVRETR